MSAPISFSVVGRPQQRGSKRPMPRKGGGPVLMIDANKKSGPWMDAVAHRAAEAMNGRPLMRGALKVVATFNFKRPGTHYYKRKAGDLLRDDAPHFHESTPDADKLLRAIGDAMSGVVYVDDKQIALVKVAKVYTGSSEGVDVIVSELVAAPAAEGK